MIDERGPTVLQTFCAFQQRVWKRQASGGLMGVPVRPSAVPVDGRTGEERPTREGDRVLRAGQQQHQKLDDAEKAKYILHRWPGGVAQAT
jgi:hypothetical protein